MNLSKKAVSSVCGASHEAYYMSALQRARKYQNILLIISIPEDVPAILPMLEAIYRPHFPNIVYCVRSKVDRKYLEKWRASVLWIKDEVGAVPCIIAAADMDYGVHGMLHLSANMLLNAESETVASHFDSLMWMTGEFDAYSPEMMSACYRRTAACVHMSRDVLAVIARTIDESPALSERQKTKLRACISKVERDPSWVARKDMLWFADVALYVPTRLVPRLSRLREVLSPEHDAQRDLLIPLMLECEQLTVNYLRHSIQADAFVAGGSATGGQKPDYILAFPFGKLESNEAATKQFCAYIEQFK